MFINSKRVRYPLTKTGTRTVALIAILFVATITLLLTI